MFHALELIPVWVALSDLFDLFCSPLDGVLVHHIVTPALNSPVVREKSTTHRIRPELKAGQLDLDSSELSIRPLTEQPESTITYRNQEQLTNLLFSVV